MEKHSTKRSMNFDIQVAYLITEEPDPKRILRGLKALRRRALQRHAKASATKCLKAIYWGSRRAKVRIAKELLQASPEVLSWKYLASAYASAGAGREARRAFASMLKLATRRGDLDGASVARAALEGSSETTRKSESRDLYRRRFGKAKQLARSDPPLAYAALRALRRSALRQRGRATATACLRALVVASSYASDSKRGARFAQELCKEDSGSWSYLALGFAEEHSGRLVAARLAYAAALRKARREGDLHREEEASAGLDRIVEPKRTGRQPAALVPFSDLKRVLGLD
jgi:hypothetical protein